MTADCSAGRLCGDCSWSGPTAVLVVVDDAFFGFGVDLFLLPFERVLRAPRDLPLAPPGCFFGFGSSAGAASCIWSCNTRFIVSSGGVRVCEVDGASGAVDEKDGSSGGVLTSKGPLC
jgi:hypothetical protein